MIKVDTNRALKDFKDFDKRVQAKMLDVLDTTALMVESRAKGKLKADGHWITGRLASSIHVVTKGDDIQISLTPLERAVGSNVVYAASIEFDHDSYLHYANMKERNRFQREIGKAIK